MAHFNLEDYETVEQRIRRFYENHPDGRIITDNVTQAADRAQNMWIVKAHIYLSTGDQANDLPKSTGYAFEIDGQGMANKTSALENCETSAIGRALANMDMSGNKRTSREEMEKVARGVTPTQPAQPIPKSFSEDVANVKSLLELESLWNTAVEHGFSAEVKELVHKRKKELNK
jgi:hypothetical protein